MSSDEIVINARNLSKRYEIYDTARDRLKQLFLAPVRRATGHLCGALGLPVFAPVKDHFHELWALSDVSFEVRRGEALGIIGRNGSGKSTLLQILAGTLTPTTGDSRVIGRVAALLELGSGFNPEFTGRENVFLNGMLLGLAREEIVERFDEIATFADIGDVLDRPVKTYSSGMLVRLAFAVQVALDPDILIVDEALSVGDYFFQQKCFGRIRALREKGMTLLFVTHDMNTVANLCSRALYMQDGKLHCDDEPHRAIRAYFGQGRDDRNVVGRPAIEPVDGSAAGALSRIPQAAQWRRSERKPLSGAGGLLAVVIMNANGELTTSVHIKEKIHVQAYFAPDPEAQTHVYIQLKNRFDEILFTTSTYHLGLHSVVQLDKDHVALAEFELEMSLGGGGYSLSVMLARPEPPNHVGTIVDHTDPLGPVTVEASYDTEKVPFLGPFGLPVSARLVDTLAGPQIGNGHEPSRPALDLTGTGTSVPRIGARDGS